MLVHDYSDNMKVSLNAVSGSYERQHYRAPEHYFVHIVQVFSKIRNILIFIQWHPGAYHGTQYGADSVSSVTDRICPIRSNLFEFVHAVVSLAPRRSRVPGGYHRRA